MAEVSFGEWLKRRRQGLGLTQQQLAAQINYSTISLKKIEAEESVDSGGTGDVAFSPDGKRLAVSGISGIYFFDLPNDELVALAKSHLTRTLTTEECQQYLHVPACPVEP